MARRWQHSDVRCCTDYASGQQMATSRKA